MGSKKYSESVVCVAYSCFLSLNKKILRLWNLCGHKEAGKSRGDSILQTGNSWEQPPIFHNNLTRDSSTFCEFSSLASAKNFGQENIAGGRGGVSNSSSRCVQLWNRSRSCHSRDSLTSSAFLSKQDPTLRVWFTDADVKCSLSAYKDITRSPTGKGGFFKSIKCKSN